MHLVVDNTLNGGSKCIVQRSSTVLCSQAEVQCPEEIPVPDDTNFMENVQMSSNIGII